MGINFILVIYCCITNYTPIQHKHIFYLLFQWFRNLGMSSASWSHIRLQSKCWPGKESHLNVQLDKGVLSSSCSFDRIQFLEEVGLRVFVPRYTEHSSATWKLTSAKPARIDCAGMKEATIFNLIMEMTCYQLGTSKLLDKPILKKREFYKDMNYTGTEFKDH